MRRAVALLCAGLSPLGCSHEHPLQRLVIPGTAVRQVAANAKVKIQIEGMACAMGCARAIEQRLRQTPGVAKAAVNFKAKEATVAYDETETDVDKLLQLVTAAGDYKAKMIDKL